MPKAHKPRSGSMQFWPRKRAKREVARIRTWNSTPKAQFLGFAGYKAGMTHVLVEDVRKNSLTKGEQISVPVSIIECPPLKIYSVRLYKKVGTGIKVSSEIVVSKDKDLVKSVPLPKKGGDIESVKPEDFDEIRVNVFTQPKLTGFGKKKPELFEVGVGGSKEEALAYVKNNISKEISVKDLFKEGQFVDTHVVTTGKGFQGPVKRFGVSIRNHKSEKTIRGPGSICGGWKAQGHMMYRVSHAGQMGYHTRTEYNKQIIAILDKPEDVNPIGGIIRYGLVKNTYVLVKGSVAGPKKRLVRFCTPARRNKKVAEEAPKLISISLESRQGR